MQILIVEDNVFNAECLRTLLESLSEHYQVTIVHHAVDAIFKVIHASFDCVVLDGNLNVNEGSTACDGPELARLIFKLNPQMPMIAWTDAPDMISDFSRVFADCKMPTDRLDFWPKLPGKTQITASLQRIHYLQTKLGNPFAYQAQHA